MIEIDKLSFHYPRQRSSGLAIEHLELTASLVLITGPSGSYKSTLAKIIAGKKRGFRGTVRAGEVFYLDQSYSFIDSETLRYHLELLGLKDYQEALYQLGLSSLIDAEMVSLSAGQRARVAFLIAYLSDHQIYILDEPTHNLDDKNSLIVRRMIKDLARDHQVVVISHDPMFIAESEQILELTDGRVSSFKAVDQQVELLVPMSNHPKGSETRTKPKNYLALLMSLFALLASIVSSFIYSPAKITEAEDYLYHLRADEDLTNKKVGQDLLDETIFPHLSAESTLCNLSIPDLKGIERCATSSDLMVYFLEDIAEGYFSFPENSLLDLSAVIYNIKSDRLRLSIFDQDYEYSARPNLNPTPTIYLSRRDYLTYLAEQINFVGELDPQLDIFEVRLSDAYRQDNFPDSELGDEINLFEDSSLKFRLVGVDDSADLTISTRVLFLLLAERNRGDGIFISPQQKAEVEKLVSSCFKVISSPVSFALDLGLDVDMSTILVLITILALIIIVNISLILGYIHRSKIEAAMKFLKFAGQKDQLIISSFFKKKSIYIAGVLFLVSLIISVLVSISFSSSIVAISVLAGTSASVFLFIMIMNLSIFILYEKLVTTD